MAELGESLSDRELEVLQCVAGGAVNKEVALKLSISENTVKVHLRNIYTKLGVSSRTEATTVAIHKGLVSLAPSDEENTAVAVSVPTTPAEPETSESDSVETDPAPAAESTPQWLNWRSSTLVLVVLLLLTLVVAFALRQDENLTNDEPTAVPFTEVALTDDWMVSRALPEPRSNMAVVAVGLNLYEIGGETAESVVDTVRIFQTTRREWMAGAAKPTAVTDVTAAELFGEIYVPGGRLADGSPTNVMEVYSPANDSWRPAQSLPVAAAGGLALSHNGFLYFYGGWDGENYLDSAYVYDPGANSWRPLPDMAQARAFTTGAAVAGYLYVLGGTDGERPLSTCAYFDPAPDIETWQDCPDMLLPRAGAGAAGLFNKLYVIGGGQEIATDGEPDVAFSEAYDPNTQTWALVNTPMLEEYAAWHNLGVASVETRIYALGGRREAEEPIADVFVYNPLTYQTFIPAASSSGATATPEN